MFIFWGTKQIRNTIGWVADFCPVCRDMNQFRLLRVGSASHVYYISIGKGTLLGHEIVCQSCQIPLSANINHYKTISKEHAALTEDLIGKTHPEVRERYRNRIELEERVRTNGQVTEEERRLLIRESFLLVNSLIETRSSSTHIDRKSGVALLVSLALIVLLLSIELIFKNPPPGLGKALFIALGLAALGTISCLLTDVQRFTRTEIFPLLNKALKPLKPTSQELQEVLQYLEKAGLKVGRLVKYSELQTTSAAPVTVG